MIIKINDPYDDPKCPYMNAPTNEAHKAQITDLSISISSNYCICRCPHAGPEGIQDQQADCMHPKYIHNIKIMIPPEELFPAIL